ncbi:GNAT family N-acetyltransferase [Pseudaestuariivita atlantica]|uniref:Acetyltransferase n=1 Tax=Pseudaestuariivita atlantica TaxID=1317121 RepID=A0A0L1JSY2_9RHOB|nr:GNAT family N-acetyltransferase [Pseudaestuariivita atlantica]KNG94493.1 acetyltransferase [Pseudaestuariivita atlantica]
MSGTFTIPEIETERLRLRAPVASDIEHYIAFRMSDRAGTVGGPYSRETAWSQFCGLVGHWIARGYGRWMVADKDTDQPLGVVGLFYPEDWPQPEVAWSVFAEGEGRGIAYEAAVASRTHAYDVLGWTDAMSLVDPANTRSVALARRLGCTPDGTYDHPTLGTLHIWRHPAPEALT